MRIAALYDIHGNLPALEAVLREAREAGVDRVLVGGDVVPGPMVRETMTCLLRLDVPVLWIQGNSEVAVLAAMQAKDPGRMPESARETVRWSARELSENEAFFASWPKTLRLKIPPLGDVLFCHGTPRHENEIFTRRTSEGRLRPLFQDLDASLVVCGHTHMPFDRMVGDVRVVNAGSVGMPFGPAGADWLLLGPDVEPRHTSYDLEEAAVRIRKTAYPQAEVFAAHNVLDPPAEAEMLEILGRAELRYEHS